MRLRSFLSALLSLIVLCTVLASPPAALAGHSDAAATPVVHAVMFWMKGCGHCEKVMTQILPPLLQKYGDSLDIRFVEVSTSQSLDQFDKAATAMGLDPSNAGVPLLIVGDHALMGDAQVGAELPGLIDRYLAAGGVEFAGIPGLEPLPAPGGIPSASTQAEQAAAPAAAPQAAQPANSGMQLGVLVMAILIAALVYAVLGIILRLQGRVLPAGPQWLRYAVPFLSVIGLFSAFYLSYVELTSTTAFCGPVGDCNAVQSSPYAKLFGVLPIGVLGAAGYILILIVWSWSNLRQDGLMGYGPLLVFALALFGAAFSIYLTYLELFVILAVCAWCLTSAVIMALLVVLTIGPAVRTGVEMETETE